MMIKYPERIVCLTEESVETLFALGLGDRIKGVSSYVKRPSEAVNIPKVSLFTSAKTSIILELRPDLVLGFSDIQQDIAKELIGEGLNVWISNHRSVSEILSYILQLGSLMGVSERAYKYASSLHSSIIDLKNQIPKRRPRVYFEEWDEPMISAIQWVSEIIEIAGGTDIFKEKSKETLAKSRIVTKEQVCKEDPDIIFSCWCGKRMKKESLVERFRGTKAIKTDQVFELEPEVFLQPGPAVLTDGISQMKSILDMYQHNFN